MSDDFNIHEGRDARDAGMNLVAENNEAFSIQFAKYIDRLPRGWVGTCEDIREAWTGIRAQASERVGLMLGRSQETWSSRFTAATSFDDFSEVPRPQNPSASQGVIYETPPRHKSSKASIPVSCCSKSVRAQAAGGRA